MHSRNSFFSLYFIFIIYTVILKTSCYCATANPFTSKQEKLENLVEQSDSSLFYSNKHAVKFHGINKDKKGVITSTNGDLYTFKEEESISIPEICRNPIIVDFVNEDLVNFKNDLGQSIDFPCSNDLRYLSMIKYIGCNIESDTAVLQVDSKIYLVSSQQNLDVTIKGMPITISALIFDKEEISIKIEHSYGCREERAQLLAEKILPDNLLAVSVLPYISFKEKTQKGNIFTFKNQDIVVSNDEVICISIDKKTCSVIKKPEFKSSMLYELENRFIIIPVQYFSNRTTIVILSPLFFDARITTI